MCKIRLAGIVEDSITDGPSLRTTIFVQGCPRRCAECHNPTAQPFEGGTEFTVDEVYNIVSANPIIGGVTFSGGEPFCQPKPLCELAIRFKKLGLDIAVYTGYTYEQLLELGDDVMALIKNVDTIIDGEFIRSRRNLDLKFRGSDNQRIIDVKKTLAEGKVVINDSSDWN